MNFPRPLAAFPFFILLAAASPVLAADAPSGASSCSGCHAVNAKTKSPLPRIYGRRADDIVTAMTEFRSGKRAATVMDRIAKGFNDSETQAIAAWLAEQK